MARTQATQRKKPEPAKGNGEVAEMDEIYNAEQVNEYLESVYSELGIEGDVDATVHVTQFQDNGMEAHVWRGDPADYDLEAIAKKFGSGQYRVKVYVRDPSTGKKPQRANRVIAWKLTPDEDQRIKQGLSAVPPLTAPASQIVLTPEAIALAVKNALPAPTAPQMNPMELMRSFADVVKTMMPAPAPQNNAVSPMEVMRLFANVMRESREAEPIERGINAGPGDIFLRLIDKFAPLFEKTLAGQPGQPQLNAPAQPGQPQQPQVTEQDEMNLRLKMGLAFLIAQAEAGNDATTYADVVLDNVPDEALSALAKSDNWFDELSAVEPKIRQHRQWFTDLMNEVREALKDDETEGGGEAS